MTDLRTAAQQALEALEQSETFVPYEGFGMARREAERKHQAAITALRAALAEPEGGGNLPPPFPVKFDHGIGADRFKVVRGAFWWHVLIGDSPTEHGKFRSRASAEKMAADLLREFRNGAFVQHEAALAEPVQEPVWVCPDSAEHRYGKPGHCEDCGKTLVQVAEPVQKPVPSAWRYKDTARICDNSDKRMTAPPGWVPLYLAPPQRKPLTEEEKRALADKFLSCQPESYEVSGVFDLISAIERAHEIT